MKFWTSVLFGVIHRQCMHLLELCRAISILQLSRNVSKLFEHPFYTRRIYVPSSEVARIQCIQYMCTGGDRWWKTLTPRDVIILIRVGQQCEQCKASPLILYLRAT